MRVALVAPLYEAVPPQRYGGTERVVGALADELVRRGHEVTLFATADSDTRAHLEPMSARPLRTTMSARAAQTVGPHLHLRMLSEVYRRADEFDVIHSHADIWTLPFVSMATPTLLTLHGRLDIDVVQEVVPLYPQANLVSISDAQRAPLAHAELTWVDTCHNGLPLDAFLEAPKPPSGGGYLAFLGRIHPEKRPDWAIRIAVAADLPLRMAAKIDPADQAYWTDVIEPLVRRYDVEFLGELCEAEKPQFLAEAAATLFPIDWPEPFGLVMIESLAAGTPVVAMRRGSVPEIITDGLSGFICDSPVEMVRAVGRVRSLDAASCRAEAARFDAAAMARRYEGAYASIRHDRAPVIDLRRRATAARSALAPASARAPGAR